MSVLNSAKLGAHPFHIAGSSSCRCWSASYSISPEALRSSRIAVDKGVHKAVFDVEASIARTTTLVGRVRLLEWQEINFN
jgi:hypothetical protein